MIQKARLTTSNLRKYLILPETKVYLTLKTGAGNEGDRSEPARKPQQQDLGESSKQRQCGNPPVMCLTAPPSMPLRLNTRLQQRNRAQSCNTLSSCRLQSAQECFPGLTYVQMEILRWQVKEHFLEEAGDRARSRVWMGLWL